MQPLPKAPNRSRAVSAFTILEIMVACAILLMVMTLLLTIFNKISNTWLTGTAFVDRQRTVRLTFDSISQRLIGAVVTTNAPQVQFYGNPTSVYFVSPVESNPSYISDLGQFGYRYDSTGQKLVQMSTYPTAANKSSGLWNIRDTSAPTSFEHTDDLAENILSFAIRYYDTTGRPVSTWNSAAQNNTLPSVIEIEMLVIDSRNLKNLPAVDPARSDYLLKYAYTNSMVIHPITSPP